MDLNLGTDLMQSFSTPSTMLEDLMDVIRSTRNLSRKFLHLLLIEQLLKLNLSFGVAEVYYGLEFLPRCKRLRDLNLSYLRHIEAGQIIPIMSYLPALVCLNLAMSATNDALLRKVAGCCPNLVELNLQSTYISDDGVMSLCGDGDRCGVAGVEGCLKLRRLTVAETRVSWVGAYQLVRGLPLLSDFDYDKIFQVFEHLDPSSLASFVGEERNRPLKLRALYSTTPSIRGESIDAAAVLCPNVEILSVMNCWMDNDAFYKFMQFEHLKTLTIFNSEGKTIDYGEGILPLLQIIGGTLENLILSKFAVVDIVSLGRSCPHLRKIALSSIQELQTNLHGPEDGIFKMLTNVELWLEDDPHSGSYHVLLQLLQNAVLLENLLIKKSTAIDHELLKKIWLTNPMQRVSRILLDSCSGICGNALNDLFRMENDLTTIRIWSCPKVDQVVRRGLMNYIKENNLYVYLEWFE
ncbi:uncharacterized protein LOC118434945 isoform X2 [Folsomia candida]|uniref:uncharacterized protein LOC118434945 isoform X2 n=1 Tax=Folsomia candida TaxID=158441 RepID=UPI001604B0B6|nr:uncharacterized protein LOC118434945 isoform X2 [Folsomia candida]